VIPSTIPSSIILQVQRRAEKKRARSFNELLEVDSAFLQEDMVAMAVVDDGYG